MNSKESNSNQKRKKHKKYRINVKRLLFTLLCGFGILCVATGIWASVIIATTPDIDADNLYSMLSENSVLYDDSGKEIESLFASGVGLRTNLNYTDMPEDLVDAFVSIEDKTFWEHKGFNIVRIFGAIWGSLTSGDSIRGTSTITQQLARNLYLEDTKSLRSLERKVKEAYYAVQLERQLSKEQIVEAYMNTIYLGSGANGVEAASQTYFSKSASDLTLAQCAVLASIPKSPNKYSPIKRLDNIDIEDPDSLDFIYRGEEYSIWYEDDYKDRQSLVLQFMKEQNKITEEEYTNAIAEDIRAEIKPTISASSDISSYFADYVIDEVKTDLMKEYDMSEEDAEYRIYNGGLRIKTTMNLSIQKIAEAEFNKNDNFPKVIGLRKDDNGNALDSSGRILLYKYSNMFDDEGRFVLAPGEFKKNDDGSMTVYKGKRLNFFRTEVAGAIDQSVEVKPMYQIEDGIFYSIPGAYLLIPAEYKTRDEEGNLILSKEFFEKKGDEIPLQSEGLVFSNFYYQLQGRVIQPQSAMVIMDYKTGGIKAMVGGRSLSGKLLFNRATATRQPGSSIKPMAVYGPALQNSADLAQGSESSDAKIWTAASLIDDAPYVVNGKLWPKNWYSGYKGLCTLRQCVEQSINVASVKVFSNIGAETSVSYLKKLGVTSIVESGDVNDMNAAALALGGMTKGISPLQMTAAYGTFGNEGVYTQPVSYTTVTTKKGDSLLEKKPREEKVFDKVIAFIMTDILRTTVTNGIAGSAAIGSHPVAGKTGTTTDNYDAWFVGLSPYYSAAVWIGNDINLELSQGSVSAARLWSKVMRQAHSGLAAASFPKSADVVTASIDTKSGKRPSDLSALDPRGTVRSEYFAPGTVPVETDDIHVSVKLCNDSGYLATPYCTNVSTKVLVRRPSDSNLTYGSYKVGDIDYEAPNYYCNKHNLDPATYPIDPAVTLDDSFVWNEDNSEEPTEPGEEEPTEPTPSENPGDSTKPDWLN
ncbi:MAG: PBP1A family penicillin-binding protein [Eubacteriales bacterium]|nr:PBP1A family penicillin-binding protein [Eubacteriales bacterium]